VGEQGGHRRQQRVREGGFLGLDNIGPIDRSHLPADYTLEQSDATGWMGAYALAMGSIAAILTWSGQRQGQDLVLKFRSMPRASAAPLTSRVFGTTRTACSTTG